MAENSISFLRQMNERRLKGLLCDFEIRLEDQVVEVHRVVLDWKSEYFRNMFSSGIYDSNQQFCREPDVTFQAAKPCIDCMYTGQMEINESTVLDVLKVAHKWQIHEAVRKCEEILGQNINLKSCIRTTNLASFHDLKDLREKCIEYILNNLEELSNLDVMGDLSKDEILDLLEKGKSRKTNMWNLWRIFVTWSEKSFTGLFCDIIQMFPFEVLPFSVFEMMILNDKLVTSCEKCLETATGKFLRGLDSRETFDVDPKQCLLLKKLSRKHRYFELETKADEYIAENYSDVFACPEILEMEEDDLLTLLGRIEEECSLQQFSVIIMWLKQDFGRHDAFKNLFGHVEYHSERKESQFLTSLRKIYSLARQADEEGGNSEIPPSEQIFTKSWWPKESLFLRSLAEKFKFKKTEAKIDECIIRDFSDVSQLHDFKNLNEAVVAKYLASPDLYHFEEEIIWNSVEEWVNHDFEERYSKVPRLLQAMLLDRLSTKFLRERLMRSNLVEGSYSSLSLIVTALLEIIENLQDSNANLTKIVTNHSQRFGDVIERVQKLVNGRSNASENDVEFV